MLPLTTRTCLSDHHPTTIPSSDDHMRGPVSPSMADKMIVDMNVCPDNTGLNDQDQGTRQAHRTSTTIREGILVDVSDTKRQKKQAMQEDAAEISFQMTGESPRKASRVSTYLGPCP